MCVEVRIIWENGSPIEYRKTNNMKIGDDLMIYGRSKLVRIVSIEIIGADIIAKVIKTPTNKERDIL